jgi:potassium/hydrogen antiporter
VLGWAGLRGAVPVVLATFPVIEGVPRSLEFFNIAFFAVLLSTVLQGASIEPLARALHMTTTTPALPRPLADAETVHGLGAEVVEYPVARGDAIVGFAVRDLGLPREALVNVIVRGGRAIPPRGSTKLASGDVLHILVREEAANDVYPLLQRWRTGPIRREIAGQDEVWMTMPVYRARREEDGER